MTRIIPMMMFSVQFRLFSVLSLTMIIRLLLNTEGLVNTDCSSVFLHLIHIRFSSRYPISSSLFRPSSPSWTLLPPARSFQAQRNWLTHKCLDYSNYLKVGPSFCPCTSPLASLGQKFCSLLLGVAHVKEMQLYPFPTKAILSQL